MVLCGIFSNLQLFLFSFVRSTHVVQRSRRPRTSFRGQTQASVSHNIESLSQTTRHDIPTSQIDTTAHLAHTSVQSRATLFSQHNSAPNSAITTNTPSSHVPLPALTYLAYTHRKGFSTANVRTHPFYWLWSLQLEAITCASSINPITIIS